MAKAKKPESEETTKKTTPRKTRAKKVETAPVEEIVNEVSETPNTDEQPKPIGTLFDIINYTNLNDLDKFVQNLTGDQSLYCVVHAAKSAHKRGVFSIEESEILSRAIRVLTTPPEDKETSVPDPEVHKAD
tara:strand:- start:933 stop:1325 length:393 start_codon:yes stop_codon:yes gene_type:complete